MIRISVASFLLSILPIAKWFKNYKDKTLQIKNTLQFPEKLFLLLKCLPAIVDIKNKLRFFVWFNLQIFLYYILIWLCYSKIACYDSGIVFWFSKGTRQSLFKYLLKGQKKHKPLFAAPNAVWNEDTKRQHRFTVHPYDALSTSSV